MNIVMDSNTLFAIMAICYTLYQALSLWLGRRRCD